MTSLLRCAPTLLGGLGFCLIAACAAERSPSAAAGSGGELASGGGAAGGVTNAGGSGGGATAGGVTNAGGTLGGDGATAGTATVGGSGMGGAGPGAGSSGESASPSAGNANGGAAGAGGASGAPASHGGSAGESSGGREMMPDGSAGRGGSAGAPADARSRCPAGPFPTPMVMSSKSICQNFSFTYSHNEGPTWVASQEAFFFTNFVAQSGSGGNILKYTPGGDCEVFIRDVGCNGLAASIDGNLLAACQQTRSVLHFDLATKRATTVADSYMGKMLDTPNDLIQHSNGTVYFTNPPNELDGRPVGAGRATFRVDAMGTVSLVGEGDSNGIALSPDEKKLYVILSSMWDLDAGGVPSNPKPMFTRGDGVGVDCAGNVYANGSIFSSDGKNIGSWGTGTNLAFGGEDGKTVLVAGPGKQLRELTMNVPGLP